MPPATRADFDQIYRSRWAPMMWGDLRIPPEVKTLAGATPGQRLLEWGCGMGRFARHAAALGNQVTAVDFSAAAIERARALADEEGVQVDFKVGDVTDLRGLSGPFDASWDVGCFHCLDVTQQARYAAEAARLLRPGATHLLWALDWSPSELALSPESVERVFAPGFVLKEARFSRRRLIASHWYRLERRREG